MQAVDTDQGKKVLREAKEAKIKRLKEARSDTNSMCKEVADYMVNRSNLSEDRFHVMMDVKPKVMSNADRRRMGLDEDPELEDYKGD